MLLVGCLADEGRETPGISPTWSLLRGGLPIFRDMLYMHIRPREIHRPQSGLPRSHFSFAAPHSSQLARSLGCRGACGGASAMALKWFYLEDGKVRQMALVG